jgi:hypothetical protein
VTIYCISKLLTPMAMSGPEKFDLVVTVGEICWEDLNGMIWVL